MVGSAARAILRLCGCTPDEIKEWEDRQKDWMRRNGFSKNAEFDPKMQEEGVQQQTGLADWASGQMKKVHILCTYWCSHFYTYNLCCGAGIIAFPTS